MSYKVNTFRPKLKNDLKQMFDVAWNPCEPGQTNQCDVVIINITHWRIFPNSVIIGSQKFKKQQKSLLFVSLREFLSGSFMPNIWPSAECLAAQSTSWCPGGNEALSLWPVLQAGPVKTHSCVMCKNKAQKNNRANAIWKTR